MTQHIFALIIAAVLGFIFVSRIVKMIKRKNALRSFVYIGRKHNAHKIMKRAKRSIYIIAPIGDIFLPEHGKRLRAYLRRGVKIFYLLQTNQRNEELEKISDIYIRNNTSHATLAKLYQLRADYPDLFEVKESRLLLTASYIGVDIDQDIEKSEFFMDSTIQVTLHPYMLSHEGSPASLFSPILSVEHHKKMAKYILDMWDAGNLFQISVKEKYEYEIEMKKDETAEKKQKRAAYIIGIYSGAYIWLIQNVSAINFESDSFISGSTLASIVSTVLGLVGLFAYMSPRFLTKEYWRKKIRVFKS